MWVTGIEPGWDCDQCRIDGPNGFLLHCRDPMILNAILVQTWTKELNSRGEVRVTALDIKATFDRVWHQGALVKLE